MNFDYLNAFNELCEMYEDHKITHPEFINQYALMQSIWN